MRQLSPRRCLVILKNECSGGGKETRERIERELLRTLKRVDLPVPRHRLARLCGSTLRFPPARADTGKDLTRADFGGFVAFFLSFNNFALRISN